VAETAVTPSAGNRNGASVLAPTVLVSSVIAVPLDGDSSEGS
jgi:hypothetical protein